jgi:hypothetical protein
MSIQSRASRLHAIVILLVGDDVSALCTGRSGDGREEKTKVFDVGSLQ